MATEQDWAAYADQAYLALTDTLLLRTSAGAGVEVAGSHVLARRSAGGNFLGTGGLNLVTAAGATCNILPDASSGANGVAIEASFAAGGYGPLRFLTGGGERMRLDPSGFTFIGTTSQINGSYTSILNIHAGSNNGVAMKSSATAWSAFSFWNSAGTLSGSISVSGSSTAYNTSSDHRLKDDYKPLTGALDRILALPVYDFRWIASGERARGFKAHEYGDVIPGAATGQKDGTREEEYEIEPARASDVLGPDGVPVMIPAVMGKRTVPDYQGIDQSKAVPDLVGAVQELAAMVTALRAEVAALKAA